MAFLSSTSRSCNCFWSRTRLSCSFNRFEASQKSLVYSLRSCSSNLRKRSRLTRFSRMWPLDVASWYTSLSLESRTMKGPSHLGCSFDFRLSGMHMTRSPMIIDLAGYELSLDSASRSSAAWYFFAASVRCFERS